MTLLLLAPVSLGSLAPFGPSLVLHPLCPVFPQLYQASCSFLSSSPLLWCPSRTPLTRCFADFACPDADRS